MPFWIGSGGAEGTCAGSTIESAMHLFSEDLWSGCKHFANLAASFQSSADIRTANTACILFGVSAVEAKLNEWISISVALDEPAESSILSALRKSGMKSSLREKWDRIAQTLGGVRWDSGAKPFQSFELVVTLRNELVHYKGDMLKKDETPNRRIAHIMHTLKIASKSTFMDDDCSSWVSDLLEAQTLGPWIFESIRPIWEQMHDLLREDGTS